MHLPQWRRSIAFGLALLTLAGWLLAQERRSLIYPEQRRLEVRAPGQIPSLSLPPEPRPNTVAQRDPQLQPWQMTLDEALRVALENAEVIRVVAGQSAVSSGSTVYDPAIINTQIDQNRAAFDPSVFSNNRFFRSEAPFGNFGPGAPPGAIIGGVTRDTFQTQTGIQKQFATGTNVSASVLADNARARAAAPLNPSASSTTELRVAQPLLQGAGARVNLAPILIARINTERSFYQLKDSVQDLVNSTIKAYWDLAFAEANAWARQQQVEQGRVALERAVASQRVGIANEAEVAQARVSYEQFRANALAAEGNLIQQEAALRNVLGLPPVDGRRISSVTPLSTQRLEPEWEFIRQLAAENRPDLIQRQLLIETDQQQLILARNQTLPELDLSAAYRWNALEGRALNGAWLSSSPGQFSEWDYGLNVSFPLGQRRARALLREQELNLMRDRANLAQTLHSVNHSLATSVRNLARYYEQYEAFRRTRESARTNLDVQMAYYLAGRRPVGAATAYLSVLLAITDWGNALSNEVNSLALYNAELARLEQESGVILENHGIQFIEESYGSLGPLGRFQKPVCYPAAEVSGPNYPRPLPPDDNRYYLKDIMRLPPVSEEVLPPVPQSPLPQPNPLPPIEPPLPR